MRALFQAAEKYLAETGERALVVMDDLGCEKARGDDLVTLISGCVQRVDTVQFAFVTSNKSAFERDSNVSRHLVARERVVLPCRCRVLKNVPLLQLQLLLCLVKKLCKPTWYE